MIFLVGKAFWLTPYPMNSRRRDSKPISRGFEILRHESWIMNHLFEEIYNTCNLQKDIYSFYCTYWCGFSWKTVTRPGHKAWYRLLMNRGPYGALFVILISAAGLPWYGSQQDYTHTHVTMPPTSTHKRARARTRARTPAVNLFCENRTS